MPSRAQNDRARDASSSSSASASKGSDSATSTAKSSGRKHMTFRELMALSKKNTEADAKAFAEKQEAKKKQEAMRKAIKEGTYLRVDENLDTEIYVVKVTDNIKRWEIHLDMHSKTFVWQLQYDGDAERPWSVVRHQLLARVRMRPRREDILVARVHRLNEAVVVRRMERELERRISRPDVKQGEAQLKFKTWIVGVLHFINAPVDSENYESEEDDDYYEGSDDDDDSSADGDGNSDDGDPDSDDDADNLNNNEDSDEEEDEEDSSGDDDTSDCATRKRKRGEQKETKRPTTLIGGKTFKEALKRIHTALDNPQEEVCAKRSLVDDDIVNRANLRAARVARHAAKEAELAGFRERRELRKALQKKAEAKARKDRAKEKLRAVATKKYSK